MKIGNIKTKEKTILAPMLSVTDIAYRILCRKYGAAMVYSEMTNAEAIARKNKKSIEMARTAKEEKPVALQIFGSNPKIMSDAAKIIEKNASMIDLNFGCPSIDVMRTGGGAALLGNPKKIHEIVKSVSDSASIPVTAKMRSGIKDSKNAVKTAKLIEKAGADAITIHPRTAEQQYSGKADWKIIEEIKKNVSVPVIGNGDIKNEEDAKKMIEETNCDFVMIGRAAIGNPLIFENINYYLKTGKKKKTTEGKKISAFFEYAKLAKKYKIDDLQKIKTQALWFTKGIYDSSRTRNEITKAKTADEIFKIMKEIEKS